jgi:hypothetical protein
MRNGPGRIFSPGAAVIQEILLVVALVLAFALAVLVVALVLAFALAVFVASPFRVAAEGAIVAAYDRSIVVIIIAL